ncbi:GDSL-type esterase/lipase family protein [Amnibacterium sp. CER49]|uniref:GDSL-type esterase/lipase family protein n=1 Tax=Amnibacterium sp. CER49 TaxID=3039161 RepID=UPI00244BDB8E|nr:GDSL-type esterase/lipase family protein [Amnibacterium sp. CER49]MDH2444596.1 GDSL-type esterase/lipase family protein [Amnibacterium sp. CER49]
MPTGALRVLAKLWYLKTFAAGSTAPQPMDAPTYRSPGADPLRVLLLGNGPVHGWGVLTHQLALTGALGRALERGTGRPVDVDLVGEETMSLAAASSWLGERPLEGVDLVVLVAGMNDAVRWTPVDQWRRDLVALLDLLQARCAPAAELVVAGIQPVRSVLPYDSLYGSFGQRVADRLNTTTREVVGGLERAVYLELSPGRTELGRPLGSPKVYDAWADELAAAAAPALARAAAVRTAPAPAVPEPGWDWAGAVRVIDEAPDGGWPELRRLIDAAKKEFGADLAYVSLLSDERQVFAATTGPRPRSVPRALSHCDVTVRQDELLIVPNSFDDPRFRDSPLIDFTQMRFYAGLPLHSASGEAVGTFCVGNVRPRSASVIDPARFGEYARAAEAELRRLEREAVTDPDAEVVALPGG